MYNFIHSHPHVLQHYFLLGVNEVPIFQDPAQIEKILKHARIFIYLLEQHSSIKIQLQHITILVPMLNLANSAIHSSLILIKYQSSKVL
jgi:hypothetical protein